MPGEGVSSGIVLTDMRPQEVTTDASHLNLKAIVSSEKAMHDNHGHSGRADHVQKIIPACPKPGISPLGWSIAGRLIWAVAALALLWLGVAWAIGLFL
jgi:hypothetical protein